MPLLMCPNCNESMQEVRRNDVQIDMCPRCRGVWLDRGELEKLLHAVDDQYERERTTWAGPSAPPAGGYPHHQPHYKRKKKKSLFEAFDIFTGMARTPDRRSPRTRGPSGTPIHIRQARRASNKPLRSALGAPVSASQSRSLQ
jgi:hypothetical protein